MRCGIGRVAKSFICNVLLATGVNDISSQVVLHKEATGSGVISMYNDPNQPPYGQPPQQPSDVPPTQYAPQPPYGQPAPPPYGQPPAYQPPPAYGQPPQPPPYGQPPYGQPPYGGVPPLPNMPPGYAAPAPQKSRKGLWITLSIIAGVLVLFCAICGSLALFASNSGPDGTVKDYYKAVQGKDYATAYTYLAPGASFTDPQSNKKIPITSSTVYIVVAQTLDKDLGALTDYETSSGSDTNHVNVSVTRGGKQYAIHLTMTKIDDKWKILNADGI